MGSSVYKDTVTGQDVLLRTEKALGYEFRNKALLREALTHRSAVSGRQQMTGGSSNERLEFLGDRVLGLIMAEWLIERFPDESEGALGARMASLASGSSLGQVAAELGIADLLVVAKSENQKGVRESKVVLADAVEALIGALYLDAGFEAPKAFVRRMFARLIEAQKQPPKEAKTELQEWALKYGLGLPVYQELGREGADHAPVFRMQAEIGGRKAEATGSSKRQAEQAAAKKLLKELRS